LFGAGKPETSTSRDNENSQPLLLPGSGYSPI
jgi:hypothetical protein